MSKVPTDSFTPPAAIPSPNLSQLVLLIKPNSTGPEDRYAFPVESVDTWDKLLEVTNSVYGSLGPPSIFIHDFLAQVHPSTWPSLVRAGHVFCLRFDKAISTPAVREALSLKCDRIRRIKLSVGITYHSGLYTGLDSLGLERVRMDASVDSLVARIREHLVDWIKSEIFFSISLVDADGVELVGTLTIEECGYVDGSRLRCVVY